MLKKTYNESPFKSIILDIRTILQFYGLKDVRNLFNQNDDENDNYEGIEYLFDKSDVNQLIEEIIESCELIEDEDEINDLIDYLEIILTKLLK